ncbi:MAG: Appr-1-p processing protein [Armatimonadetes bacterium RBG_16_58_9]|nr:MAG: Appr-1-p processing protein [Armatimonadetes bacterium RBG_16_58_9]
MVEIVRGNLLEADADALVNTVNTVGIMGKGVALQFRQAFPENYKAYRKTVDAGEVVTGRMFVFRTHLLHPRYIINFPTKRHWRGRSRVEDIEAGLADLVRVVRKEGIQSLALPPLGCGSGGLEWRVVRPLIESALAEMPDVRVLLFEPSGPPDQDRMRVATQRPKMTPTRAALVMLLNGYAAPGYKLSGLEAQKLAYLLQAAGQHMRLEFAKGRYGPYAEVLNHVLQDMEGHYIRGYGDRSRDAAIRPLPEAIAEAERYLSDKPDARRNLQRVLELIDGFETPYGMELLATTHWSAGETPAVNTEPEAAVQAVHSWSDRKRRAFSPQHVRIAWQRLKEQGWLQPAG